MRSRNIQLALGLMEYLLVMQLQEILKLEKCTLRYQKVLLSIVKLSSNQTLEFLWKNILKSLISTLKMTCLWSSSTWESTLDGKNPPGSLLFQLLTLQKCHSIGPNKISMNFKIRPWLDILNSTRGNLTKILSRHTLLSETINMMITSQESQIQPTKRNSRMSTTGPSMLDLLDLARKSFL